MSDPQSRKGRDASSLSEWTASHMHGERVNPPREAGFTPGTMLAGRYRIVAPLGKGGMGEVYRADDTKLGQPVALKFVRGALSPELLERLYAEVRIGRQVSHPNVCRLYDVVEVQGQTFLAMEYVDGEDLASLLARIGRLPPDKALDIAHDLAAGLAAAHDKGIVHRDLKPANVMIDGRGRARLTDFGLAVALEAPGPDATAGTPAYMSPEQLAGAEITSRSDLYALGLILYEMFTGRRFFEARTLEELLAQHREPKGPKLASAARLLDPKAEAAILNCLEEEPANRPQSARAAIASLPGGDPLEAAVAAGETPSPEMVAAAGKVGDVAPAVAWSCLLAVVAGVFLLAHVLDRTGLLRKSSLPKTPELLAERAREVLLRLGHAEPPTDFAYSFEWDRAYVQHLGGRDPFPKRWDRLGQAATPFRFFYRQSPRRLIAVNRDALVTRDDPPADVSGMLEVVMNPAGRLASFLAVPPQVEESRGPWPEPDWVPLFREAGLDPTAFKPVPPQWAAPVDSDHKAAWEGPHPDEPATVVRTEAAAYHGRAVWFAVLPPWAKATRMADAGRPSSPVPIGERGVWILALAMPLGGFLLARRNLRLGRGDRKGAFRVSTFVFVCYTLARLFRSDHTPGFNDELWILIKIVAYPAFWAAQVWLLYVALEPFARRRWPHILISWKRLLGGNLRDPLVGRDILVGAVAGTGLILFYQLTLLAPVELGLPPLAPLPFGDAATLTSFRHVGFRVFVNQFSAVLYALVFLFMLVLLRVISRKQWLSVVLWCVLIGSPLVGTSPGLEWFFGLGRAVIILLVLLRCGLLGLSATLLFMFAMAEVPLTLDVSAWYATRALPMLAFLLGLAAYGFHTSLGGKPIFGRALLDD